MNTVNLKDSKFIVDMLSTTLPFGSKKPIAINLSGGDVTMSVNCRMFSATAGTAIKVDITASDGVASGVIIPPNFPCVNVTKVYQTGTDCSNIYGWPIE
jgi:hypothetical protein